MADTTARPAQQPEEKPTTDHPRAEVKPAARPSKREEIVINPPNERRRDALIFIGAALVLSAFIVKDAIRERLKDFSDAIDKIQTLYVVKDETAIVDRGVKEILISVLQLTGNAQKLHNGDAVLNTTFAQRTVDNAWNLVAKCPDGPEKAALSKTMTKLKTEISNAINELTAGDQAAVESRTLGLTSIHLGLEAAGFERRALHLATKRKEEIEHRYNISTIVSYALYCVVVVFGVVAKLSGVDVPAGE